ncbi:MAG TPA: tetratricopeptide repeat protein [Polyangia bacterium]|nr:tetratricopeptide repeat protein [Polyangia bacterium]
MRTADTPAAPVDTDRTEHPEELLDGAARGGLTAGEQEVLDRHLSVCRVCAGHLALVRSAQQHAAPQPWDDLLNRRAVEGALTSARRGRWRGDSPLRFGRRWAMVAAGVTLLGLGGIAGATWWHAQRPRPEAARARALASAVLTGAPSHRAPAAEPADEVAPEPPPPLAPPAAEHRAPAHATSRAAPSASALFEQASALRDQNRPRQAVVVFRRLQRLYPQARETRLSFALAGRLLLDGGQPAQALAQFDQHLAQRGEASEEALAGRATALGRMGRPSDESDTWRALLDGYPNTVYAPLARRRLAELGRAPAR